MQVYGERYRAENQRMKTTQPKAKKSTTTDTATGKSCTQTKNPTHAKHPEILPHLERRIDDAAGDQSGNVRHVAHQQRTARVRERTHALVVPLARVPVCGSECVWVGGVGGVSRV
jgi:hypothetical protein